VIGGHGPTWWGRPMPPSIARWPHHRCHVTDPWESLHTASPKLIHVGLIQGWRLSSHGSMGPLSSTWRGQTDLQTDFLTEATDLPAMQPPLGAIKHHWMERRWDGRSADAPYVAQCPLPLHNLISAYKYPLPSTHYKRSSGARWRSSLKHSKLSKKLSRVVAS